MVEKLKSKIFFLIMISLSIITIGIVVIFTVYNYNNTINTSTFFIDRVYGLEDRKKDVMSPKFDNNKNQIENEEIEKKEIPFEEMPQIEVEGFYSVKIINNEVVSDENTNLSDEIKQFAIDASNKKRESGIVGNYIYRIRKEKNDEVIVMLVENEDAIKHIKILMITSICISILALIIIYIIAKKVSELIVKPVEETFLKQIQFISDSSHELKTPLAVIEANADVLENEIGKNKWLGYIQNEVDSMDKLVNDLLLLAKIENVDNIKQKEEFNLSKETEMCMSLFESNKQIQELNNKIINELIEDIFVSENGNITIKFKYQDEFEEAIKFVKENRDIILAKPVSICC